ncbi:MAG TPA: hypothetical protein VID47_15840 [Actinomycetota bacterium]
MTKAPRDAVEAYLRRLDAELGDLPKARRSEIVAEIREHVDAALEESPAATEADVRNVLERIGEPSEIAAEARARFGIRPPRAGGLEVWALILIPIGGLVVPVIGWIVGVALLWASRVWTTREKWIGTLIVPGGLAPAFFLTFYATSVEICRSRTVDGVSKMVCTGGPSTAVQILESAGTILLFVLPIATLIYLVVRLRRRTQPVV